ncbi:ImmA/IrrE family metallo-endopeptidase [Caballeronia sp. BR00000012568055]|uniref:ImmA/IrrE family metallo-endopeptidase n=1 Tax=Caballeronia sp. BR00000012568055 TaxID=2918761 RepID=UPI0023F8131B|nr:ImmA/IrrE family metallo-endopeptidase [Caballeronia sp. BR00000012568055]
MIDSVNLTRRIANYLLQVIFVDGGQLVMAVMQAMEHWDGVFPVDAAKIARSLGVEVDVSSEMDAAMLGRFEFVNGRPRITVNANSNDVSRRYAIAHELGHYMLHHGDYFEDTCHALANDPRTVRDALANEFARELLMPGLAFETLIMKRNLVDPREMIEVFGVSMANLEYRLEALGWIPSKRVREAPIRAMQAEIRAMEAEVRRIEQEAIDLARMCR